MLTIVKVSGRSMEPKYKDGDYLLLLKRSVKKLRQGNDIVFSHPIYGTMVKQIKSVNSSNQIFTAIGLNPESLSEEVMGEISFKTIKGFPIYHFSK